jgi:hypothetical protein
MRMKGGKYAKQITDLSGELNIVAAIRRDVIAIETEAQTFGCGLYDFSTFLDRQH